MHFWLYRKFIFQKRVLLEPTTLFSLFGISLGVAFLVVSMAGFSGFSESLKNSIIDVSGDVSVARRGGMIDDPKTIEEKIRQAGRDIRHVFSFVNAEILVAQNGELAAVLLQGIDLDGAQNLKQLKSRIIDEVDKDQSVFGEPSYLGKVVAQKLGLKVGDSYKAVLPKVSRSSATQVTPHIEDFYVHGILDLGKYEFNDKVVIARQKSVQKLSGVGDKINGFRIRLNDSDLAALEAEKIQDVLGWDYSVKDWTMTNRSLFRAIRYEKQVLFFVMLIMVVAAFFNVATTLFLSVLKRYSQISVLRALGLKKRDIILLFCIHGLTLGSIGLFCGLVLGLILSFGFEKIQKIYPIMPEEVYKLSHFSTQVNLMDIIGVVIATLVICFLSTLAPALKGASLSPVEGLKYE